MLKLWRRFNYRRLELGADAFGSTVIVLESDGRTWNAAWQGFIARDVARRIEGARSVRLVIDQIENRDGSGFGSRFLTPGEYVQGCCIGESAWAVIDHRVRIVPGPSRDPMP